MSLSYSKNREARIFVSVFSNSSKDITYRIFKTKMYVWRIFKRIWFSKNLLCSTKYFKVLKNGYKSTVLLLHTSFNSIFIKKKNMNKTSILRVFHKQYRHLLLRDVVLCAKYIPSRWINMIRFWNRVLLFDLYSTWIITFA